jgi:predicted transcriptional regulator
MLLDTTFHNSVTLGAVVLGLIVTAATVIGILYGVRYKVSYEASAAAADELRKSLEDAHIREENLRSAAIEVKAQADALVHSLRDQLDKAHQTIAKLEAMPDLAQLAALMEAHEVRAQERYEGAERRMGERHAAEIQVLTSLATEIRKEGS